MTQIQVVDNTSNEVREYMILHFTPAEGGISDCVRLGQDDETDVNVEGQQVFLTWKGRGEELLQLVCSREAMERLISAYQVAKGMDDMRGGSDEVN